MSEENLSLYVGKDPVLKSTQRIPLETQIYKRPYEVYHKGDHPVCLFKVFKGVYNGKSFLIMDYIFIVSHGLWTSDICLVFKGSFVGVKNSGSFKQS